MTADVQGGYDDDRARQAGVQIKGHTDAIKRRAGYDWLCAYGWGLIKKFLTGGTDFRRPQDGGWKFASSQASG